MQNKDVVASLFGEVAEKVATRPGGYTRVIRTGFRKGDGAEMAMIELVDFNTVMVSTSVAESPVAKTAKRTRRSSKKTKSEAEGVVENNSEEFNSPDSETKE